MENHTTSSSTPLNREFLKNLRAWKESDTPLPLFVLGARQVGKTFGIKEFGKQHFPKIHEINFEKNIKFHAAFEEDLDPKKILATLSIILNTQIKDEDLIFFDEIQACPKALTSLKYFAEDPKPRHVISAGSLLGVSLTPNSFPVGKVNELRVSPLTFLEFLNCVNPQAHSFISNNGTITQAIHDNIWQWFIKYLFVGGLPAIVNIFLEDPFLSITTANACREKQNEIINQYINDFAKHSGKINALHIERVFRSVASQLGRSLDGSVQRFRFKGVLPGVSQYNRLASSFDWLEKAMLIKKVPIINHIEEPLISQSTESNFKAYLFDIGILGALADINLESLLNYSSHTYKGFYIENFVLQELVHLGYKPFGWNSNTAEIEFVINDSNSIVPIEVKSKDTSKAKSLASYIKRYNPNKAIIFGNTLPRVDGITKRVPLYFVEKEMEDLSNHTDHNKK